MTTIVWDNRQYGPFLPMTIAQWDMRIRRIVRRALLGNGKGTAQGKKAINTDDKIILGIAARIDSYAPNERGENVSVLHAVLDYLAPTKTKMIQVAKGYTSMGISSENHTRGDGKRIRGIVVRADDDTVNDLVQDTFLTYYKSNGKLDLMSATWRALKRYFTRRARSRKNERAYAESEIQRHARAVPVADIVELVNDDKMKGTAMAIRLLSEGHKKRVVAHDLGVLPMDISRLCKRIATQLPADFFERGTATIPHVHYYDNHVSAYLTSTMQAICMYRATTSTGQRVSDTTDMPSSHSWDTIIAETNDMRRRMQEYYRPLEYPCMGFNATGMTLTMSTEPTIGFMLPTFDLARRKSWKLFDNGNGI